MIVYIVDSVGRVALRCFFFNQKTAYEMRISDWSSDVCSSDLLADGQHQQDRQDTHGTDHDQSHLPGLERADYRPDQVTEIGRASGREKVCQDESNSVDAGSLPKTR